MLDTLLRFWTSRAAPWVALAVAAAGVLAVRVAVDVSPRVEGEFFFAEDDPQMRTSREVAERFPGGSQVVLRVAGSDAASESYRTRIGALTADLQEVADVERVMSVTTDDAGRSPLFARVLLTRDANATNVVLEVGDVDPEVLLPRVEEVVSRHHGPDLDIVVSGVPVVVELIRRSLNRDLVVFSAAALLLFALLVAVVYRDAAIVVGTLATCAASVSLTLLTVGALGVPIGLLTANLVTIVFVLTLSHVVFLTGNWSHAGSVEATQSGGVAEGGGVGDEGRAEAARVGGDRVAEAVRRTLEPSFWSMATTLLGFVSLLVATARPLRELGTSGAVGTVAAFLVAYTIYPAFLARWARTRGRGPRTPALTPAGRGRGVLVAAAVATVALGAGVARLDTDPGLLTYFAEGSLIRDGLEEIDADGGTSPLDVVVRDPAGGDLSDPAVFARLEALQEGLEADSATGVVLSPVVLMAHARTMPLAGFLPLRALMDLAASERLGGVGLGYATPERDRARFSARMREAGEEPRAAVLDRVEARVEEAGLETVAVAGLYALQGELGRLIRSSLAIGVGGLLLLFFGVALAVSRSPRLAAKMWLCLLAIPAAVLGVFGHGGIAVDIITSPAANIALAMGADSMIHLVVRVRTLTAAGAADAWGRAVDEIGGPVLGATGIIAAGFGIFVLSSFPPTQRFGLAVILGSAAAATVALLVLPRLGRPAPVTPPQEAP